MLILLTQRFLRMSHEDTFSEEFELLFERTPVSIKLQTGDDILCVLYRSRADGNLVAERPLVVFFEERKESGVPLSMSRLGVRFERWAILSRAAYFPLLPHHIITMSEATTDIAELYHKWANRLYDVPVTVAPRLAQSAMPDASSTPDEESEFPTPTLTTTEMESMTGNDTPDNIRNSFFDFVLKSHKFRGKPN